MLTGETGMMRNKVMTLSELAEMLRCHPTTIYRLLRQGKIPAFKIGSDWRFNAEDIDAWRKNLEIKPHVEV